MPVVLGDHQGLSVSTRHGKSEDLEREEQRSLVLDVYLGKRKASIRLNDSECSCLKDAAARAVDMARVCLRILIAGCLRLSIFQRSGTLRSGIE